MVTVMFVNSLVAFHGFEDESFIGGFLFRQGAFDELFGAIAEVVAIGVEGMRREAVGLEHLVDADGQVFECVDERAVEVEDGCFVLHDTSPFFYQKPSQFERRRSAGEEIAD